MSRAPLPFGLRGATLRAQLARLPGDVVFSVPGPDSLTIESHAAGLRVTVADGGNALMNVHSSVPIQGCLDFDVLYVCPDTGE